jgi:hypothetical protein
MTRYIIRLRNGVNTYYAGSDRALSNRWTSQTNQATRWNDKKTADLFKALLSEMYHGQLTVIPVEVVIPDYDGVR